MAGTTPSHHERQEKDISSWIVEHKRDRSAIIQVRIRVSKTIQRHGNEVVPSPMVKRYRETNHDGRNHANERIDMARVMAEHRYDGEGHNESSDIDMEDSPRQSTSTEKEVP
jgi:hypothetical protein